MYDDIEAEEDWLVRVALGEIDDLGDDRDDDPDPDACQHTDDDE